MTPVDLIRRVNYRLTARFTHRGLAEFIDKQITELKSIRSRPRVLTIGAGGVLGARIEARRGELDIVSIDIDPAREPDVVASFCDLSPFADGEADAVFAMEVLEHVTEPALAIAAARRVLTPGGRFIGSTPFLLEQHDVPADFYRYTRYGLEHLLGAFASCRVEARGGYFSSTVVPLLRLSHRRSARDLSVGTAAVAMTYAFYPFVAALDRWIESPDATTGFTFVAIK